ncbi:dipeptide ABC transporter ATP-binding protein [Marinicella gelatinilytica]|uniref:dipeptide ABC transporter ATP-binding protein n=1 Tax=Marinicella gelatinilytica TaxID=2996017 RepID=UPI002260924A|nr:ABC transporter ATP-binding protein [Marinicella gelatinilytica]MCX7544135.1 ABC transporter ATP-binding protein [Marinicella gelatinilytica]
MNPNNLVDIRHLTVCFAAQKKAVIKDISFHIKAGETLGLAGASGSGKSLTALAIMGLLPAACQQQGQIHFKGQALTELKPQQWRALRGQAMAMVFQEPMTALNPVQTIGRQIAEMLLLHTDLNRSKRRQKVQQLLHDVQLDSGFRNRYPHQLSGGQKQRAVIAMAVACQPDLLICDEPTTALDVTTQQQIIELLNTLQQKYGMAMLFISHDLAVMAQIADRIAVMQQGEIVETETTQTLLQQPKTDYSRRLLAAAGLQPSADRKRNNNQPNLMDINNLTIRFKHTKHLFKQQSFTAVDQVNLVIKTGEIVGLVGESGSGKTTLGRSLVGLQAPASGQILFQGQALSTSRRAKKRIQMIFQDPYSSLNPQLTIQQSLSEPLTIHGLYQEPKQRRQRLINLLSQVGLDNTALPRYPHQFSGGQRQRIAIARALACEPDLLICDEAVTALDVLVQQHVLALLERLVAETGLSLLFITHDIALVSGFAHRLAVMQQGRLIEQGETREIIQQPRHHYTQQLINSVPRLATTA